MSETMPRKDWLPGWLVPRSLSVRVVTLSTIWTMIALIILIAVFSAFYRQASERGFRVLLHAHMTNMVGAVGVSEDNRLQGNVNLGSLLYSEPRSGWYWSVTPIVGGLQGTMRSSSLQEEIASPSTRQVPFNSNFTRNYRTVDSAGNELEVLEREFILGEDNSVARFRITGNRSILENDIWRLQKQLLVYLGLFGIGTVLVNAAIILAGLKPLSRVRDALVKLREGKAQALDMRFPSEIQPLADETNALIDNNKRILERARTQVGNLAHSLKTPLAVITNEAHAFGGQKGRLIEEQANAMRSQVEHYLQRARIAAQRDSVVFRTDVHETLERMVRVMRKLDKQKAFKVDFTKDALLFSGEREDLEELAGNLIENAMKWGKDEVRISTMLEGERNFLFVVEDDGPGIPANKAADVLKRGRRLDETTPGSGLGLAIVADLISEYGGSLKLERSELGGLKVVVELPRIVAN
ncbi:ATP-binding protein [Limoniibacter endophyticus]|uniref:histidine kinase n=1 Tax=Limoniibacter endophyticus TaxID=1565040 RepID=A0A8J3DI59_9HYPH|nr:ATP-binding protein [Limoniibacter endophyticus]GHC69270.1 histidine kinase [Limoniibacter endophyticus]